MYETLRVFARIAIPAILTRRQARKDSEGWDFQ
jgi:hypothetical protein